MTDLKTGILLWSQAATWPETLDAAKRVDRLGYDHLWTWDHLYGIFGDPYQPIFEGWTSLAAWAMATDQTRLGLLVGREHVPQSRPHGQDGRDPRPHQRRPRDPRHRRRLVRAGARGPRHRLRGERRPATRLAGRGGRRDAHRPGRRIGDLGGRAATTPSTTCATSRCPIQKRLPIMIGGSGEKKTLRTVAKYADMWNAMGTPEVMAHKVEVLRGHCDAVGRDIGEIEFTLGVKLTIRDSEAEADRVWKAAMEHNRTPMADVEDDNTFWNGSPEQIADRLRPYVDLGFRTVISEQPAPVRRRDVRALHRRGQAAHRPRASAIRTARRPDPRRRAPCRTASAGGWRASSTHRCSSCERQRGFSRARSPSMATSRRAARARRRSP